MVLCILGSGFSLEGKEEKEEWEMWDAVERERGTDGKGREECMV